jgi:hypothetical protein
MLTRQWIPNRTPIMLTRYASHIGHNYAYTAMNPKSDTNYAHAVWIPYRTQLCLHGNESQIGHQLCSHGMNPDSRTPIMFARYESQIGHQLCTRGMNPDSVTNYAHWHFPWAFFHCLSLPESGCIIFFWKYHGHPFRHIWLLFTVLICLSGYRNRRKCKWSCFVTAKTLALLNTRLKDAFHRLRTYYIRPSAFV